MTKIFKFSLLVAAFSVYSFATSNNCPGSVTPTGVGTNNNSGDPNHLPIAASNANTSGSGGNGLAAINAQTNGFSTGVTSGCGAVNQTFGNFNVSNSPSGGASTYAWMSQNSTSTNLFFTGLAGTDANPGTRDNTNGYTVNGTNGTTGTNDAEIQYLTQFGTGTAKSVTTDSVLLVTINGVTMNTNANSSIVVTINLCGNATSAGTATIANQADCTALGGSSGGFSSATHTFTTASNLTGTGTLQFAFVLPSGFSSFAVDTDITLNARGTGSTTSFISFEESFESPEPSTFILLGSALAGVAWLRRRRYAV